MSANLLDVFKTARVILKFDKVRIDNNISRLHYKLTVIVLVVFSLLVTSKQYFGEPIQCHLSQEEGLNLDAYCWIFSTFTVKKHFNATILMLYTGTPGKHIVAAGVASATEKDEVISQKYYQWVCFVLALQAAAFYIPRHLWKTWEAGRLKMLVGDLGSPIVSAEWTAHRKKNLLKYIALTYRNTHTMYAFRYIFCEFLNFLNVVAQIYSIDKFLGGTFTTYGPKILELSELTPEERMDPMSYVFPKIAKCSYRSVGPSGGIELRDALCILPLNILNEKIFMFLWFWFGILSIISLALFLYRLLTVYSIKLRKYLLMAQARHVKRAVIDNIVNQLYFGDWFMLNMLGKNMNPIIFRELVVDLGIYLMSDSRMQQQMIPLEEI